MTNKTIQAALADAISKLSQDNVKLDAEILLAHLLQKPRSYLYAWPESPLNHETSEQFDKLIERRCQGEPIAHITGLQEFWSLPFKVTRDTLIPRPETELLVEQALLVGRSLNNQNSINAIDLGTGSGCIALAIAHEQPNWAITACDASEAALKVARENASSLNLETVSFIHSDWFKQIPKSQFDLIISNPPYIASDDHHLQSLRYEPDSALSSGKDGLDDIIKIGQEALSRLAPQGTLLLEIGYDQSSAVETLLRQQGYTSVNFIKDLTGHPRVCIARLAKSS